MGAANGHTVNSLLIRDQVAYCASKHAVIGITKAAALDCAPHRIYVNAICPGCKYARYDFCMSLKRTSVTASAMTSSLLDTTEYQAHIKTVQPLKGVGTASDVARMAVVLGSDDCSWVTGVALPVDGGFLCQ